jgi:hypothetical protein
VCRNIKPLYNFEPEATDEEIDLAALQFIRKITGYNKPSKVNEVPFFAAVDEVKIIIQTLFSNLETKAPPRDRDREAKKAKRNFEKRIERLKEL